MSKPLLFVWVLLIVLDFQLSGQTQHPANGARPVLFKEPATARLFASGPLSVSTLKESFVSDKGVPVFLQFEKLPSAAAKKQLAKSGIELHEYIPGQIYLASANRSFNEQELRRLGVTGFYLPDKDIKMAPDPSAFQTLSKSNTKKKYHIWFAPGIDSIGAVRLMEPVLKQDMPVAGDIRILYQRMMQVSMDVNSLEKLLEQPFVLYALPVPDLFELNLVGIETHLAGLVHHGNSSIPGLTGEGVQIGLGDAGRVYHIDLGIYQDEPVLSASFHATHVAGTLAGKGIMNPVMKGFAYNSRFEVEYFNNIIFRTPELYHNNRMVITNNSYGGGSTCLPYAGQYSGYCGQADQQLLDMPHLVHVFAAGNTGTLQCGNFPTSYRTIDNAFQAAKNVLTVGGTNEQGTRSVYSKGPTMDGRIKPEIVAISTNVLSAGINNNYTRLDGTSMASPQVSGSIALLYERYRQLFNGDDPDGDLIKALICNTATDIGTKYVDFANGFGWLNTKKAVETLNKRTWFDGAVENQEEVSFEINLAEPVKDFKIMLYWHDKPASYYSAKTLVNDLDITVQLPDGSIYDPFILDTSVTGVLNQATRGKDRVNNIEQVVIENAQAGRYLITVKGHEVPLGPQAFKVVYNWDDGFFELLQPTGGERYKHGQPRIIQWRYAGHEQDTYEFFYSSNNGNTWTIITAGQVAEGRKQWTLPGFTNNNVLVKIKHLPSGQERISQPFSVLPEVNFTLSNPCESSIGIHWRKPTNDSVAILLFNGKEYETVAFSADTVYHLQNLKPGQRYWIAMQPTLGGIIGERSIAKTIVTNSDRVCVLPGVDNDFSITALDALQVNRSSSSRDSLSPFVVKIRNEGNSTVTADSLLLRLLKDGMEIDTDTLVRTWLPGQIHTWTTNLKPIGEPGDAARFELIISHPRDANPLNDTTSILWKYLAPEPISLPFEENFERAHDSVYVKPGQPALSGLPDWDASIGSGVINLKTVPSKGMFISTKMEDQTIDLIGNYNISNYSTKDEIRLSLTIPDFIGLKIQCFIRGNDTTDWVAVSLIDVITQAQQTDNINISRILQNAGQEFSSSFQIRFRVTHASYQPTIHFLKTLRLYTVEEDLRLLFVNYSKLFLTDGDSVRVRLWARNEKLSASAAVKFGVNFPGGSQITTELPSIGPGDTSTVSMTLPVKDWSASVSPIIAWIYSPNDHYRTNDTITFNLNYSKKIDSFPYLEGFETGRAGWGSTYLYEHASLLESSIQPFKAANGDGFWGTRWVSSAQGVGFIVPSGYLTSPLFDLREVENPYFSASVNKQLCDEKDSVFVEYSIDTGRVWNRLLIEDQGLNWYSAAQGNAWIGCNPTGFDRWRMISAPLPKGVKSVQIRFASLGRSDHSMVFPKLSRGMLIDDFHVYNLVYPIFNGNSSSNPSVKLEMGQFHPALSSGHVFAGLKGLDEETMTVHLSTSRTSSGAEFAGNPAVPQNWVVQPSGKSKDKKGTLRLYITDDYAQKWLTAHPCDTCRHTLSVYDLSLFRYAGPSETVNHALTDNQPGFETVWDPSGFQLVPYEKGYYAEISTELYGEFYLGRNINMADLAFVAERLPGADIVQTNWSSSSWGGVVRLELERSTSRDADYQVIHTMAISGSTSLTGSYKDDTAGAPQTYYYRIKLIYGNGQTRYSVVRSVSFSGSFEAQIFPNPGRGNQTTVRITGADGGKLTLELIDLLGKRLGTNTYGAGTRELLIDLSPLTRGLRPGIYYIRVNNGKQKRTMPLVISGN